MTAETANLLSDALAKHNYDDAYHAYLTAALEEAQGDVAKAIQLADHVYAENPTLDVKPQEDDAQALFGVPAEPKKKEPTYEEVKAEIEEMFQG